MCQLSAEISWYQLISAEELTRWPSNIAVFCYFHFKKLQPGKTPPPPGARLIPDADYDTEPLQPGVHRQNIALGWAQLTSTLTRQCMYKVVQIWPGPKRRPSCICKSVCVTWFQATKVENEQNRKHLNSRNSTKTLPKMLTLMKKSHHSTFTTIMSLTKTSRCRGNFGPILLLIPDRGPSCTSDR
jgi:hypothetical protein